MAPLAQAVADPRPPGPAPALDYAKLGSLSLTPKQALDADARAVDMVSEFEKWRRDVKDSFSQPTGRLWPSRPWQRRSR